MSKRAMERRSHARFERSFELQGSPEPGGAVARMVAKDLSLGGLYCVSPADFPEMTRLAVRLVLPDRKTRASDALDLEAVVVRRKPLASITGNGRYELALFFSAMSDSQRERLARFLAEA